MFMNQMRIRYDKESWIVSHYLAEFFKMCGFLVCEEYHTQEALELEFDEEVEDDKELIIEASKKELGKQLLVETLANLSNTVDVSMFHYLIDAYVDFSICSACFWLENYCKHDSDEHATEYATLFLNAVEFLTKCRQEEPNNYFVSFAILYLKYKIKEYEKLRGYTSHSEIEELFDEFNMLTHTSPTCFAFSENSLLGSVYALNPLYAQAAYNHYTSLLTKGCTRENKALTLHQLANIYLMYAANINDAKDCYYKSLKLEPNNVFVLYDLVCLLNNEVNTSNEKHSFFEPDISTLVNEQIEYLDRILELLNEKEKEIPLSLKELKLRVIALVTLMAKYLNKPIEDYLKVISLGRNNFLEKYYHAAITAPDYFNLFSSKQMPIAITERALAEAMKLGYSILYYSAHYLDREDEASKYMEKASRF